MSLTVNWVAQKPTFNTVGSNQSPDFTIDSQGNIYVVYDTDSIASGQTSSGGRDIVVFKLDSSGTTRWVKQQPAFNTSGNEVLPSIAVDVSDNIYVTYQTTGTTSGQTHQGVGTDIIVFKMEGVYGEILWIVQQPCFNTTVNDLSPNIDTDTNGYIYVGYHTEGGVASGQSRTGAFDIVIFKLEPLNGGCLWVIQQPAFNGPISNTYVNLVVGPSNDIYCSYQIIGAASGQVYSGGLSDVVVFKIEPIHGECLWVSQTPSFNTKGTDTRCCLDVDVNGNAYVCYQSTGKANGQTYTGGASDIVIFKLEGSNGQLVWVTEQPTFNTTNDDTLPCISTNIQGYIYVCYETNGTASGQTYTGGDHDITILKLEPNHGQCMWINQLPIFNTDQDDLNPKMIADQSGNLYLTYQTTGTPTTGGQTLTGSSDIIVYSLTPPFPQMRFNEYTVKFPLEIPVIGTPTLYTFEVENTGALPIYNVVFNDNLESTPYTIGNLLPGQIVKKTLTRHLVTQDDFDLGYIYSQATVDGSFYESTASDYAENQIELVQVIDMLVSKQAIAVDNFVGGFIKYEITAKNMGNVPFIYLFLTDTKLGITDQLITDILNPGQTVVDIEDLLITEEIFKEYVIHNTASITASDTNGLKHTYTADNVTTLCLLRDSLIQMMDGTTKSIQDIKRGDHVSPGHIVSRLCEIKMEPHFLTEVVYFEPDCLGPGLPHSQLGMTSNHPVVYANARRPAKYFNLIKGVSLSKVRGLEVLYDLQFDHDGTYIANGVEVQSCSPRSAANPLPLELYYDKSLYSEETVWDAYEHPMKLSVNYVTPRMTQPNLKRKNYQHRRQRVGEAPIPPPGGDP